MSLETLVRTLGEQLQAEDGQHGYLLLDPMLREPLADLDLSASGCEVFPIPIDLPQLRENQWPRLIKLKPSAVDILSASVDAALSEQSSPELESREGMAVGGWLRSAAEPRVLVRHLQALMRPFEPRVGRRYLRLADRRVVEWLWPVLSPSQHQAWLGPIVQWWCLDRRNELLLLETAGVGQADADRESQRLTLKQWTHLHDCELAQQMLRGWISFAESLPTDYLHQIEKALKSVRLLGVTEPADIVLMSAYQLQIHPGLCEHPRVVELVRKAQGADMPLLDALAEIPDPEGWDRIRHELMAGSAPEIF